jgi:hypothetical protein
VETNRQVLQPFFVGFEVSTRFLFAIASVAAVASSVATIPLPWMHKLVAYGFVAGLCRGRKENRHRRDRWGSLSASIRREFQSTLVSM